MTDKTPDPVFTEYFSHFGAFAAYWLFYEHMIEILIGRELRLDTLETSIVCCAMPFGVKFNVLKSLLRRDSANQKIIELLGQVQASAARNSVAHGFLVRGPDGKRVDLVTRDVKGGKYVVKSKPHDSVAHMHGFMEALENLQLAANLLDDSVNAYSEAVAAAAKEYGDLDSTPPESPESSPLPSSGQG